MNRLSSNPFQITPFQTINTENASVNDNAKTKSIKTGQPTIRREETVGRVIIYPAPGNLAPITLQEDNQSQLDAFITIFKRIENSKRIEHIIRYLSEVFIPLPYSEVVKMYSRVVIENKSGDISKQAIRKEKTDPMNPKGQDCPRQHAKTAIKMLNNCKVSLDKLCDAVIEKMSPDTTCSRDDVYNAFSPLFPKYTIAATVVPENEMTHHINLNPTKTAMPNTKSLLPDTDTLSTKTEHFIQESTDTRNYGLHPGYDASGESRLHYTDKQLWFFLQRYSDCDELISFICDNSEIIQRPTNAGQNLQVDYGSTNIENKAGIPDFSSLPTYEGNPTTAKSSEKQAKLHDSNPEATALPTNDKKQDVRALNNKGKFIMLSRLVNNKNGLNQNQRFYQWLDSKIKNLKNNDFLEAEKETVMIRYAEVDSYIDLYGDKPVISMLNALRKLLLEEYHQPSLNVEFDTSNKKYTLIDELTNLLVTHGITFDRAQQLIGFPESQVTEGTAPGNGNNKPDSASADKEKSYSPDGRYGEEHKLAQATAILPATDMDPLHSAGIDELAPTPQGAPSPQGDDKQQKSSDSLATCHSFEHCSDQSLQDKDDLSLESGFVDS